MSLKRSRGQIIAQILALCQEEGAIKTRVVYQVNLNFGTVNTYLNQLQKKELLEAVHGNNILYKTTPAGEKALKTLLDAEAIYS